jgi:hypothetical protein
LTGAQVLHKWMFFDFPSCFQKEEEGQSGYFVDLQ